jgi:hypothetical protein
MVASLFLDFVHYTSGLLTLFLLRGGLVFFVPRFIALAVAGCEDAYRWFWLTIF